MKLKEAPRKIKIEVTESDIKRGSQGSPNTCAIAKAVKRVMGDHPTVTSDIEVTIAGKNYTYDLPLKAENFIINFDEDKKSVKPFSFIAMRNLLADPDNF